MTAGHIRIPSADIQQFWSVHSRFLMCLRLFISVLQTVSYARFLLPTNALVRQKSSAPLDTGTVQTPMSRNWINGQKNFSHQRFSSTVGQEAGVLPRHWNNIAAIFTVVMRRVSFDIFCISCLSLLQVQTSYQIMTPTCWVILSGHVGSTRGSWSLVLMWWAFSFWSTSIIHWCLTSILPNWKHFIINGYRGHSNFLCF